MPDLSNQKRVGLPTVISQHRQKSAKQHQKIPAEISTSLKTLKKSVDVEKNDSRAFFGNEIPTTKGKRPTFVTKENVSKNTNQVIGVWKLEVNQFRHGNIPQASHLISGKNGIKFAIGKMVYFIFSIIDE